jgi:rRNA maturation endonuclease Nob1
MKKRKFFHACQKCKKLISTAIETVEYCGKCGTPLKKDYRCPKCGKEPMTDKNKFCPFCGSDYFPTEAKLIIRGMDDEKILELKASS